MFPWDVFIVVITTFFSLSFGRWLYDMISRHYPVFRRLERDSLVCVVATAIIFLIIFIGASSPILFGFTIFSLENIHYCALMFFSMGFLTPLSILPWLHRHRAQSSGR